MAIWAVSIAMALLLSSQVASTSSPTSLIKDVCASGRFNHTYYKFCLETLPSEPRVLSAANLVSISNALINAGISKAMKTQSYARKLLKRSGLKPDYRYVLQQCDAAYNYYRASFGSALKEVKEKDYQTANYDLRVTVADDIKGQCQKSLDSKKIKDGVISKGNDLMILFGEVAAQAVNRLPPHKRIR